MPEGWTPETPTDMLVEARKNYEASLDELDFCPACKVAIGGYSVVDGKRHYYIVKEDTNNGCRKYYN